MSTQNYSERDVIVVMTASKFALQIENEFKTDTNKLRVIL